MIDSAGYGNERDLDSWRRNISDYIKSKLLEYKCNLEAIETEEKDPMEKINKMKNLKDNRVHLLLYFFAGHHTNACDFTMLKEL